MAEMSALRALDRKQQVLGDDRRLPRPATDVLEPIDNFLLPPNVPLALGDMSLGHIKSLEQGCSGHASR